LPELPLTLVAVTNAVPDPNGESPSAAATPEPSPLMPVVIGSPVAFVRVAADGVPRFGVTKTGDVAKTALPEPVVLMPPKDPALLI